MAILIPRQPSYWRRKPNVPVEVDRNNPIGERLTNCIYNGANTVFDGATASIPVSSGDIVQDGTLELPGINDYVDMGPTPVSGSTNRSLFAVARSPVSTSHSRYLATIDPFSSGLTSQRWSVAKTTAGVLRVEINGSGHSTSLSLSGTDTEYIGCSLDGTQLRHHRLFLDGAFENATGTATLNTNSSYNLRAGNAMDGATTRQWFGSIDLWLFADSAMADEEFLSLSENPYQVLKRRKTYFLFPDTGAAPISTKKLTTVQTLDRGFGQVRAARLGGILQ